MIMWPNVLFSFTIATTRRRKLLRIPFGLKRFLTTAIAEILSPPMILSARYHLATENGWKFQEL